MKVRMKVDISGTRGGVEWPPRGAVLECGDEEGRYLIHAGMADPVTEFRDAETAVVPKAEERADASEGLTTKTGPTKGPVQRKSVRDSK